MLQQQQQQQQQRNVELTVARLWKGQLSEVVHVCEHVVSHRVRLGDFRSGINKQQRSYGNERGNLKRGDNNARASESRSQFSSNSSCAGLWKAGPPT